MRDAELDSEVLTGMDLDETPPPPISMAGRKKTKSRSPDDDDIINPRRVKPFINILPRS